MTQRGFRSWWAPVVVFVAALALRAWYVDEARRLPDFTRPLVDAGYHDYWAWGIASGEWTLPDGARLDPELAQKPYFRPPLPAYWLAVLFRAFGHDHLAARWAQILLGSLSCVLVWHVARKLFDDATGVLAGLLAAGYWVLVYFDTEYREVSLLVFLYLALVTALLRYRERPGAGPAGVAGAALGLAVLAKPNGLLLLPLAALWMLAVARGREARRGRHAALFAAVTLLVVLPVTVRNATAGGDLALVSTNGGINLYIGNNPRATGVGVDLPPDVPPFDSAFDYPELVRAVEARTGHPMRHSEVSRWFAARAFEWMRANPGEVVALAWRKAVAFWRGAEIVSEKDLNASRAESRALRVLPIGFAAVAATALLGACLALFERRDRRPARASLALVLGLVAVYWLSFLPFFVTGRYRAPIVPLLLLFSAHAARRVFALARAGRWPAAAGATAACAALAFVNRPPALDPADASRTLVARGAQLAVEGRLEEAERVLRNAVEQDPTSSAALNNLGMLLLERGRPAEALVPLRRALELAPRDFRAHQNLGLALVATEAVQEALPHLDEAGRLQPLDASLPLMSGQRLLMQGRPRIAQRYLARATELAPQNAGAWSLLGLAHAQVAEWPQAVQAFTREVQLAPDDVVARKRLDEARSRL